MLPGDVQLFLVGIAAQLDDLHAIQQRPGNGGRGVGRGDEHHTAEIHRHLHKVVAERTVLLAVQHLQQRGGGVAPHVAGQLVDLVQHQQRIHGARSAQRLDDTSRHGADVRFPVSPDVGLVTHAAQTEPRALAVHSPRHGHGHGGLAHAGRPHQAQDLPLGVRIQLPHGDELQHPFLHLVQPVVLLVQYFPRLRHVRPLTGGLVPRQLQAHVQIVPYHRRLGAAEGLLGQPLHLFCQLFMYLVRQVRSLDPGGIFLYLLVAVIAQLVLQHLHLLPQDHVLLHLRHAHTNLLFHLGFQ